MATSGNYPESHDFLMKKAIERREPWRDKANIHALHGRSSVVPANVTNGHIRCRATTYLYLCISHKE